jgi:hypothetical protein
MSDQKRTFALATDPRRHGVIEVRFHTGLPSIYRLTIGNKLWASVEWSPSRRAWCIEDGVGLCLAHVEHIHGQDPDAQAAIQLAKRMIRNGRMPTPEEALSRLQERNAHRAAAVHHHSATAQARPQPHRQLSTSRLPLGDD